VKFLLMARMINLLQYLMDQATLQGVIMKTFHVCMVSVQEGIIKTLGLNLLFLLLPLKVN
jgi:hypothetical protein